MLILVVAIGEQKSPGTLARWMKELEKVPEYVEQTLKISDEIVSGIAKACASSRSFYVASVGPNFATAYDGALKIEEMAWIPAVGNEAEETIHGPLASISAQSTVVLIAPEGRGYERVERIAKAMNLLKFPVIAVAEENAGIKQYSDHFIGLPFKPPELITPLLYIIPLFELAYWVSIENGHNPDSLDRTNPIREQSRLIMMPLGTH
jgi:glucosamine--fructose-6-phosphate aminotransferase (isomerizing)